MDLNKELGEIGRGDKEIPKTYLENSKKRDLESINYEELLLDDVNKFYTIHTTYKIPSSPETVDSKPITFVIDSRLGSRLRPAILDPVCVKYSNSPQEAAIFHYNLLDYILQKEKEQDI